MTLTPETRVMLTDALRPPAGHRLDLAVATTYSLNLTALLLAPLSFALFDQASATDLDGGEAERRIDPIRMLEAVRRYAERTTVFVEAGGIHVPTNYRSILTFVEDSVLEVLPPDPDAIFHPKIWALRFIDHEDNLIHRFVILSRNMTLDRSWDTALVLNEDPEGTIDGAPAGDFVQRLPELTTRIMDPTRRTDINALASTLGRVTFAAPEPFTGGTLVPIGLDDQPVWPFPKSARRLLAISPFLTRKAIAAIAPIAAERTLLSRPESLEMIGSDAVNGWRIQVLQRPAEIDPSEDAADTDDESGKREGTVEGLHAKTFVLDTDDGESVVITGSANLTRAPWGGGVEFDAVLTGPTTACGVRALLEGSPQAPGLGALMQDYTVTSQSGETDASLSTAALIERFHRQLAANPGTLTVRQADEDAVSAALSLTNHTASPGETKVWPASLRGEANACALGPEMVWSMATIHVTPFIVVETTAGEGEAHAVRRCLLKVDLAGDVDGRRHDAVFSILSTKQDVLRYLVFLLGDPSYEAMLAQAAGAEGGWRDDARPAGTWTDVALFEPLVRAMGRDEDALARVASLIEELRAMPEGPSLIPEGFEDLWDTIWQVHLEQRA